MGRPGGVLGGFWGLLFGSAFFVLPGFGPIMVLGPMAAWIVGALESAAVVGGLSALGAGLYGAGIPKDSVLQYETAVKTDKFVVLAHGTAAEVAKAGTILETTGATTIAQHNASIAA